MLQARLMMCTSVKWVKAFLFMVEVPCEHLILRWVPFRLAYLPVNVGQYGSKHKHLIFHPNMHVNFVNHRRISDTFYILQTLVCLNTADFGNLMLMLQSHFLKQLQWLCHDVISMQSKMLLIRAESSKIEVVSNMCILGTRLQGNLGTCTLTIFLCSEITSEAIFGPKTAAR